MSVQLRTLLESIPVYRPGCCPEEQGEKTAIKLSSNELPWGPPPPVIAAITEAAFALNRYPDFYKVELVAALAARYGLKDEQVGVDNGSGTLLQDMVRIVADQGDEVIYATPSFAAYKIDVLLAGAVPVEVPLDVSYTYDLAAMRAAITDRTRLIFICNPNNPTGTLLSSEALRAFLQQIPSRILVVVDEAYHEFVTAERQDASLHLLDEFDNVVLMRTFSKAFGMAGMRLGYCMASPDIIDACNKTIAEFSVSAPAQAGALACLEPDILAIMQEHVAEIVRNRDDFERCLDRAGIDYIPSQSNFIMLPGNAERDFARLSTGGLICRPFEEPAGIRITVGSHADMDRAVKALGLSW